MYVVYMLVTTPIFRRSDDVYLFICIYYIYIFCWAVEYSLASFVSKSLTHHYFLHVEELLSSRLFCCQEVRAARGRLASMLLAYFAHVA